MPDGNSVRPWCPETNFTPIDGGTLCLESAETPTPVNYCATPSASTPTAPAAAAPTQGTAQDDRQRLVAAQDSVRNDIKYYKDAEGATHCNWATRDVVSTVGGPIDPLVDNQGNLITANEQAANLAQSPKYKEVTAVEAQQLANTGKLVIAAYRNPQGHGHLATVRPAGVIGDEPFGQTGPVINDIGAYHRVAHRSGAFSMHKEVHYYAPK